MLKYALLAGAMTIAAPALAQSTTTSPQTAPTATTGAADPSMSPAQTAPGQMPPTQSAPGQSAQTAQATQPASSDQVAQVIDTEFPTYDKNGDGKLSTAEFGDWMVALKTKTDPATKPGAPETKKWVAAAFAQADTDKNKSLSKPELTSFLSQG
ncbi:EF-hand domain-containing protein [Sphingomonas albertensis]|uniref:EF-hand domain-containing protein n=1 Tax=Sphingomonas albertensis TaxID=2762591 RepID=A0ABR7ARW4_9SPHN|nr:EF-hand domain-containing protein [Sphingomonas albertensis]MBC3943206.1 EF-hand domain-containing protein [Sphingomonas albertensis]